MNFTFFTLGGLQFWEDVFFCRKWRIQRNCFSGRCRLLDGWNIRRAAGSYEQCRQAFEKYCKIYQLPPMKKQAVLLLHSWGRSKNELNRLANSIEKAGFEPIAVNFASTRRDLKAILKQLDFLLCNLRDVEEISFVGCGVGGVVLRSLLNSNSGWRQKIRANRAVQINPPNRGNRLADKILQYRLGKWILGLLAQQCESEKITKMPSFPAEQEFAILTTDNKWLNKLADRLPANWQKFLPKNVDSILPGAKENQNVKIDNFNAAANPRIVDACINFIKIGRFVKL